MVLYSVQDYLLTVHSSLLEHLEAYHKVCKIVQRYSIILIFFSSLSLFTDHLAQLIQLSGGTLVSSIDESATLGNSKTCVVCDEKRIQLPKSGSGLVHVKSEWILNCISNYR